MSRNKRRKLVYLAYCVCASEAPGCEISQDDLRYRYRDTNYGLTVSTSSGDEARKVQAALRAAFQKRGYTIYSCRVSGSTLEVSGFYRAVASCA